MTAAFLREFGRIDVLICNAGIARQELFTDITEAGWREVMGVDLDGVFYCAQAALPDMLHRKAGKIITLSSMWGQVGASCEVAYSTGQGRGHRPDQGPGERTGAVGHHRQLRGPWGY